MVVLVEAGLDDLLVELLSIELGREVRWTIGPDKTVTGHWRARWNSQSHGVHRHITELLTLWQWQRWQRQHTLSVRTTGDWLTAIRQPQQ